MADVFLSYAREDRAAMLAVADAVRREGYEAWWDDEIPAHVAYGDLITEKIRASKATIVLWSASAARSQWVRAEADIARADNKLIQATLDRTVPPLPFNMLQAAPLQDWAGEMDHPGWRQVRSSLAALCGGTPTAAAPLTRPAERPALAAAPLPAPGQSPPRRNLPLFIVLGAALLAIMVAAAVLLRGNDIAPAPGNIAASEGGPRLAQPAPVEPAQSPKPAGEELDGEWSVLWSYAGQSHSGRLNVTGASAVLDVRVRAGRVRQDCTVSPSGDGTTISCRNPRFVEGRGVYAPDTFTLPRTSGRLIGGRLLGQSGGPETSVSFLRV